METRRFFQNLVIVLMLAGSINSCTEKPKNDLDHAKAILGKWEKVEFYFQDKIIEVIPDGSYIEFFSDGIVIDYDSEKDELYEKTYKIDENFICYDHEKTYEQGRFDYKYKITKYKLEMTMYQGNMSDFISPPKVIYQRKK